MGKDYLLCDYNRDGDSYRWVCEKDTVIVGITVWYGSNFQWDCVS
jgi:hypothetical protein